MAIASEKLSHEDRKDRKEKSFWGLPVYLHSFSLRSLWSSWFKMQKPINAIYLR
jgi:hypothetical protein